MNDEKAREFARKYNAKITQSRQVHYRYAPLRIDSFRNLPGHKVADIAHDVIPCVDVTLPEEALEHLINLEHDFKELLSRDAKYGSVAESIYRQQERESKIRRNNPAAQKAYDKYLQLIALTGNYYDQ